MQIHPLFIQAIVADRERMIVRNAERSSRRDRRRRRRRPAEPGTRTSAPISSPSTLAIFTRLRA